MGIAAPEYTRPKIEDCTFTAHTIEWGHWHLMRCDWVSHNNITDGTFTVQVEWFGQGDFSRQLKDQAFRKLLVMVDRNERIKAYAKAKE